MAIYPDLHPTADQLPPCQARWQKRHPRAERLHFPQNRLEPRRDLTPLQSACEGPECLHRPLTQMPRGSQGSSVEMETPESQPGPLPSGLTPRLPGPSGEVSPLEVIPTPSPIPSSPVPPPEHEAFSASATEFLPQEKSGVRPLEKFRARFARKSEPASPPMPTPTTVIEQPLQTNPMIPAGADISR